MYNPPFKSDLFYSVQNEDYQSELAVLRRIYRGISLRVLLVASSGENALSLLTQDMVASVDEEFNAHLRQVERGPWFRTIAVGFCG